MHYHKFYLPFAFAALATATVGCVDDNYDLSDIDTTTKLTVNDLVVPVNFSPVTLGDIITYDEDSKIKPVMINGVEVYALSEKGSFSSDPISIAAFDADAPYLAPTETTLSLAADLNVRRKAEGTTPDFSYTYVIENMGNNFEFNADNVDDAIIAINSIVTEPLAFRAKLQALNVDGKVETIRFTNVVMQMPKGLTIDKAQSDGTYDATTGLWKIANIDVNTGVAYTEVKLVANAIDFVTAGCQLVDHKLDYKGEFTVLDGLLTLAPKTINGIPVELPENLDFRADYTLDKLVAKSVTGEIEYKVNGMDIAPITLEDIPDFLSDNGSNIIMTNPQIYLQVNNPVAQYDLYYSAQFCLTAYRDNAAPKDYTAEDGLKVMYNNGVAGPYNFVMSPLNKDLATPADFAKDLDWIQFSSLGHLLADDNKGIPSSIGITVINPEVPRQSVKDFTLNTTLPGVEGKYELIAPLDLSSDSKIVYSDVSDGWFSEDSEDDLVVEKLVVTATIDNAIPASVVLSAKPLDRKGNEIQGVQITSSRLLPMQNNQDIVIEMNGIASNIDGVRFTATVNGGDAALSPSQTITLNNIKARVSGYYITKF